MAFVYSLLVLVHLFGAAVIIGTWIATFRSPTVTAWQFWSSVVMLLSGLLLVGIAEMGDGPVNHAKIAVKLLLSIGVFVAALIGHRKAAKGEPVSTGLAHGVGGTALINMAVAVLW
ncbi:hypothetical protein [Kocuria palustris]|uniref:hypothetical protein n=1 Tax=Kocuria palustris TaxID=71999 RepID=UPI00119EDD28|nr:hypothetical protein [Kocuria palustris]